MEECYLTLLRGCFSCFLNCTNGTKSRKVPQWHSIETRSSSGPCTFGKPDPMKKPDPMGIPDPMGKPDPKEKVYLRS